MELKPPKAKIKSNFARLISKGKMFKTPLLILLLLGTTNCDNNDVEDLVEFATPNATNLSFKIQNDHSKLRHSRINDTKSKHKLSEIRYLRRRLNKEIVNFVMTDVLVDGEVENRIHYNGITAKETLVGADGHGLKLRQLTDGRHLIQVIYAPNGEIQDCEYLNQAKFARDFLKSLRKELKQALEEETYRILEKSSNSYEEKFFRHFGNVSFRILKNDEELPPDVSDWMNYESLKSECLRRHEELTYMIEKKNKVGETSLSRSRRSMRENFIVPGTKWCGAGQLAETYNELGPDVHEDRCCRAHDNCRKNIGAFKRRFGYFNLRPFTISHCRCDRRFRACLKLADTSVSNMVGKLFFNVVQTKCFILKPVKVCVQRSWFGKCLRRGYTKQAYLRNNLPY